MQLLLPQPPGSALLRPSPAGSEAAGRDAARVGLQLEGSPEHGPGAGAGVGGSIEPEPRGTLWSWGGQCMGVRESGG